MDKADIAYLIIGGIIPLFLLGFLGFCAVVAGIRRGEIRYRGGTWIRGHDWGFWLMAAFGVIAGIGTMLGATWFGLLFLYN